MIWFIQERHVLSGGLSAEYEGGAGLLADNRHVSGNKFSTFDSAYTLSGAIIQDKLWFFTSYQVKEREDDVFYGTEDEFQRRVKREESLGFAKLS